MVKVTVIIEKLFRLQKASRMNITFKNVTFCENRSTRWSETDFPILRRNTSKSILIQNGEALFIEQLIKIKTMLSKILPTATHSLVIHVYPFPGLLLKVISYFSTDSWNTLYVIIIFHYSTKIYDIYWWEFKKYVLNFTKRLINIVSDLLKNMRIIE